jgi:hypothetical protein
LGCRGIFYFFSFGPIRQDCLARCSQHVSLDVRSLETEGYQLLHQCQYHESQRQYHQ